MFSIFCSEKLEPYRYYLGQKGERSIFILGLNPSTAYKDKSDTTITRVEKVTQNHSYDGFVMINLFPLRCTDPSQLPARFDPKLIDENIKQIKTIIDTNEPPVIWAAWGKNIVTRKCFTRCLDQLIDVFTPLETRWFHYGSLTKAGHPRHPSRLSYSWKFHDFNVNEYLYEILR